MDNTEFREERPPEGMGVLPKWISVNDRLPEKDMECLIYLDKDRVKSVWNSYHLCWDDRHSDDYLCDPKTPTHWMPLPEPPS